MKVCQVFNLDETEWGKRIAEKANVDKNPNIGTELIKQLKGEKYEVFVGLYEAPYHVPTSLIVSGKVPPLYRATQTQRDINVDFYRIAEKLGIPFSSGESYW